jgi:ubiquinone/menaquinone biosynthesis C-methylase UbiE
MISDYDAIAEWYAESFLADSPVQALSIPALFALLGDLRGQRVCDLACGQGIVTRELAWRGAEVVGIDMSASLLEIARDHEVAKPLGITYLQGDAQSLSEVTDAAFNGVVCHLALMDVADLPQCLQTVARILRSQGWFAFAITHPCFQTPESRWTGKAGGTVKREVRGYFREGFWRSDNPAGVRGKVGAYHRTLSTYVNALEKAGLKLERMLEPQPQDAVAGRVPGYHEVPVVLVARCRRCRRGDDYG